jgi:hypothetical protein
MIDYSYFFWLGSFDLLIMTIQDLRSGYIDDRYNYLMFGVVAVTFMISQRSFEYFLAIFAVATLFPLATKKFFAKGDLTVLTWMLLGLGIMGPTFLGMFFLLFPMYLGIHLAFRTFFKITDKVPGLPILAGTFWTITAVFYIVFIGIG